MAFIKPAKFDRTNFFMERLSVYQPRQRPGDKQKPAPLHQANIRYQDENGQKSSMYVQFPEQFSFGVNQKDQGGFSMMYSATSQETKDSPTEEEESLADMVEQIELVIAEYIVAHSKELKKVSPAYGMCRTVEDAREFVRSTLYQPKVEDPRTKSKIADDTKAKRIYADVIRTTNFYGPGDKQYPPQRLMGVRMLITPVVWLSHVHFGAKAASLKIRLHDVNFVPSTGGQRTRMSGKNDAPEDMPIPEANMEAGEDDDVIDEENDEDVAETSNPVEELDNEPEVAKPKKKRVVRKVIKRKQ